MGPATGIEPTNPRNSPEANGKTVARGAKGVVSAVVVVFIGVDASDSANGPDDHQEYKRKILKHTSTAPTIEHMVACRFVRIMEPDT